jgi:aminoglycoside 3-N-acetyltransferase
MQKQITIDTLVHDLRELGVVDRDVLYIRGDLGEVGHPRMIEGKLKDIFINALLEAVGPDGTIMTESYTSANFLWKIDKSYIFTKNTKPKYNALPKLFMNHKDVVRSKHPTNSYLAIGKYAHYILDEHDTNSLSYTPLGKLLEFNGKIISFGTLGSNYAFPTTHYVEETLGLTKKNMFKQYVYYIDDIGRKQLFRRVDIGGCTRRAYTFYSEYKKRGIMNIGNVGMALSALVDFKESYLLEYEFIKKLEGHIGCDNPNCINCNLIRARKKYYLGSFLFYRMWITLVKILLAKYNGEDWRNVIRTADNYIIADDPTFFDAIKTLKSKYKMPS